MSTRIQAEPFGRVVSFETGEQIGLVYRWDNGDVQLALDEPAPAEEFDAKSPTGNPDSEA